MALPKLLAAAEAAEAAEEAEARPFDWSACDWTADDPFALATAPSRGGACAAGDGAAAEAEAAAREGVGALLRRALTALGGGRTAEEAEGTEEAEEAQKAEEAPGPATPPPAPPLAAAQGSAAECDRAAAVYREGQRVLLREALGALGALEARGSEAGVAKGVAAADHASSPQKKPRLC